MNNINFDANYFSQSKENIINASTYMNDTLSSVSAVNGSIPASFNDASGVTDATTNIKNVCEKSGAIVETYNGWEKVTTNSQPTMDSMETININNDMLNNLIKSYPFIANVSPQRKAIITMAFEYLGQTDNSIKWLSGIWCAKFAGGIINKALGINIINNTESVAKILGLSGNPNGLAFTTDSNYKYILSKSYTEKYKKYNGNLYGWEIAINRFNSTNGRNIKPSDWIDENYVPQTGDLIFFNDVGNSSEKFNANEFYTNAYPGSDASVSHVGLVVGIRQENGNTYVDTIEGNVSDTVKVKSYDIGSNYIVGYGNIKYENIAKGFTAKKDESSNAIVPPITSTYDDSQYADTPSPSIIQKPTLPITPKPSVPITPTVPVTPKPSVPITPTIPVTPKPSVPITPTIPVTPKPSIPGTTGGNSSSGNNGHSSNGNSGSSGSVEHSSPTITTPVNILPENKFSDVIPEIKYGELGNMEISDKHVQYNISNVKETDYTSYLDGLNKNGYTLSNDGTYWLKDNNRLYVNYSNSNLNITFKANPFG